MAEPAPRNNVVVADWPGLQTNTGAAGGPSPGSAAVQVNLAANVPGELAARPGYRVVRFDGE
jgi:hypothetical protein